MAIALCLYEDNRIHSAWKVLHNGNYDGMPIVDTLPAGNIADYLYINGEYIYDPLPIPEEPESGVSQEERIAALEEENAMLLNCLLELSEIVYA